MVKKIVDILYIHQDGLLTGSAISLRNLLLGLDRQRFRPRVLLAREGPARQLYEVLNIPVDMIPIHGMWTFPGPRFPQTSYFRNWLALLPHPKIREYLQNLRPALVHVNDKTLLPAGRVAKRLGLPVVWHLRSSYVVSHSHLQAKISCGIIRHTASHLIAISEDEIDGFGDLPNLSIIYNSVDISQVNDALKKMSNIRKELGIKDNEILVGTVSTALNENRGSWDFLQAAGLLNKHLQKQSLRFVIVAGISDPKMEADAWARAEQAGIRNQLILTGFRNDALAIMAAMDVVIICSRRGVVGRMPFEAMALGRPLVVTSGNSRKSKVVVHDETALVVPPADPVAISNAAAQFLSQPELGLRLSTQGSIYARMQFDPAKNAQAVMKIYDEVLHQDRQAKNQHD